MSPTFSFDRGNNCRICHILCVKYHMLLTDRCNVVGILNGISTNCCNLVVWYYVVYSDSIRACKIVIGPLQPHFGIRKRVPLLRVCQTGLFLILNAGHPWRRQNFENKHKPPCHRDLRQPERLCLHIFCILGTGCLSQHRHWLLDVEMKHITPCNSEYLLFA